MHKVTVCKLLGRAGSKASYDGFTRAQLIDEGTLGSYIRV